MSGVCVAQATSIAVVGAGVAGLGAAWALSRAGWSSVLFEKSRGLSGRAATRRRGEVRYDHGANFFRLEDPDVHRLLTAELPADDLVEISGEVWTFDGEGEIRRGDPAHNAVPKWSYRGGIKTLGHLLAEDAPLAQVRRQCRVVALARDADGSWWLDDESGAPHGPYPALLLTPPAPQSLALLESCPAVAAELLAELARVDYHRQFSFVLGYQDGVIERGDYHALVNLDGQHAVAWLSFEEDKPGHVPVGQSVMVVQMSPAWSSPRYEQAREDLLPEVLAALRGLFRQDIPEPDWWDSQRWGLAHPQRALRAEPLAQAEAQGLFVAGDATVGKGRVPLALKSGLEIAGRMRVHLQAR